jgi:hypothetical protein
MTDVKKAAIGCGLSEILFAYPVRQKGHPVWAAPQKVKGPLSGALPLDLPISGSLGPHGRQLLILLELEIGLECDAYVSHSIFLLNFLYSELGNLPTERRQR